MSNVRGLMEATAIIWLAQGCSAGEQNIPPSTEAEKQSVTSAERSVESVTKAIPGTQFVSRASDGLSYYVANGAPEEAAPLLFVQGSGCDSVFRSVEANQYQPTAGQNAVAGYAGKRLRVVMADKPGVLLGNSGGDGFSESCSQDFLETHTLDNWVAYLGRIMDTYSEHHPSAAQSWRVIGLSEGAVTAARLASMRTDVSHVGFISGHGCYQLDDMLVTARRQWLQNNPDASAEAQQEGVAIAVQGAEAEIRRIFNAETKPDEPLWGQTAAFWQTFGTACPATDLGGAEADLFVAYGTDDPQVVADGIEEITARRLAAGKPVRTVRVVGGGHTLSVDGDANPFERLLETLEEVVGWMSPVDSAQ